MERSLAWRLANWRPTVRYKRRADILTAFLRLVCTLIRLDRAQARPGAGGRQQWPPGCQRPSARRRRSITFTLRRWDRLVSQ